MATESDIFELFEAGNENTRDVGMLKDENKTKRLSTTFEGEKDKTRTHSFGKGKLRSQRLIISFNYYLLI